LDFRSRNFFIYIFLFILQNYMIVSKFIRFDHQTQWRTAAAVDHGGWNLTVVGPSGWSLTAMAHGAKANLAHGRRQAAAMQPSWATAVVFF
jgi:hypothetical protein